MIALPAPPTELLPLVRLVGSRSPVAVSMATMLILGLIGSMTVLVGAAQGVAGEKLYKSAVQLWINSLATGYVLGILLYEIRRLSADLARIRPQLSALDDPLLGDPDLFLRNRHPRTLALVTLGGALFGAFFNYSTNGLLFQALHHQVPAWEYAWGPMVLISLWTAVFHVLWIMLDNAWLLAAIAREHIRVRLANVAILDLFAHAGIRHLLMIVVGLTVIPIQTIMTGALDPLDFIPALAIILPVGLLLLGLPVFGAHRAIAAERSRELDRVDRELVEAAPHSDRYLLLAVYRHQIDTTPAWPLSLRSLARIALYLVIPPLAWVAAALVESLISDAL